jgi:hypothetical protein
MAKKKPTAGGRKKADEPEAPAESTLLMPATNVVVSLAGEKRRTKKRIGEISGEHADSVKSAADKKHLDKKAFAMATSLDALSDEKLQVTYFHLLRYMDDLKIPERASAQEQLPLNNGDEETEEETAGQEQGHGLRVVRHGEGRQVAEAAGER